MVSKLAGLMPSLSTRWVIRVVAGVCAVALVAAAVQSSGFRRTTLALRQGLSWLPTAAVDRLVQVSGTSAGVAARVEVTPAQNVDVTQLGDGAIVADGDAGELTRVQAAHLEASAAPLRVEGAEADLEIVGRPGQAMYVVSARAGLVRTFDLEAFSLGPELLSLGHEVQVATSPAGILWVLDQAASTLQRVSDGRLSASTSLGDLTGDRVVSLTVAGEHPVLLTSGGAVVVDPDDLEADGETCTGTASWTDSARPPLVDRRPSGGAETAAVVVPDRGRLVVVDVGRGACPALPLVDATATLAAPSVTSEGIYVPDAAHQRLHFVPAGRETAATVALPFALDPTHRVDIFEHDGFVWLNNLDSVNAGLLRGDQFQPVPKFGEGSGDSDIGTQEEGGPGTDADQPGGGDTGDDGGPTDAEGRTGGDAGADPGQDPADGGSPAPPGGSPAPGTDDGTVPPSTAPPGPAARPGTAPTQEPVPGSTAIDPLQPPQRPPDGPNAQFSVTPALPRAGEPAQLEAVDGSGVTYEWSVNGGRRGAGRSLPLTFPAAGTYEISLTVGYAERAPISATRSITVLSEDAERPPQAALACSPAVVRAGQPVQCTDRSLVDGEPVLARTWDFGAGAAPGGASANHTWPTPGEQVVRLTVRTTNGVGIASRVIDVLDSDAPEPLRARFAVSATTVAPGRDVRFTDQSTGGPTGWQWQFGDGNGTLQQNPVYRWQQPGTYTVSLRVTSNHTRTTDMFTGTITVTDGPTPPVARMSLTPDPAEVNQDVRLTDSSYQEPDSITVDWGDGTVARDQRPGVSLTHRYGSTGSFSVRLTAVNELGSDTIERRLTVASDPVLPPPSFTFSPGAPDVGQSVSFTGASSANPTSWEWDFGDGSSGSGSTTSHSFGTAGPKTVRLTIRRGTQENSTTRTVDVGGSLNVIITGPDSLDAGQSGSFQAQTSPPAGSVTWDFGDGTGASGANAAKAWSTPGPKTIQVQASWNGQTRTATKIVQVGSSGFVVDFSAPTPRQNTLWQLTDQSTGNPDRWSWRMIPGGTWSSEQHPVFFVVDQKELTVELTACRGSVCGTKQRTYPVEPNSNLVAIFTFAPAPEPAVGETVSFRDRSSGGPDRWEWTFSDGFSSTAKDVSHSFTGPGTYTVRLRAWRGSENAETVQQITVTQTGTTCDDCTTDFTWSPQAPIVGQPVQFSASTSPAPFSSGWRVPRTGEETPRDERHDTFTTRFLQSGDYEVILSVCWPVDRGPGGPTAGSCKEVRKTVTVGVVPTTAPTTTTTEPPTTTTTAPPTTTTTTPPTTTTTTAPPTSTSSSSTTTTTGATSTSSTNP